jgi:hypothetical protein
MSLYEASVPNFIRMLNNLERWFDKAEAHAAAKKFDAAVYLTLRLAPDQLPFVRQVQIACDSAKNGCARITGKSAPSFADNEASISELRARVHNTVAWLETLSEQDFVGAETRKVAVPGSQGKVALGRDNLYEHAIPNFYFHVSTSYAILRHNGVDLGKLDYLGERTMQDA